MGLFSSDTPSIESGNINVIAELKAKAEYVEEIRTLLVGLVAPSRKEDGCKGYHLLESRKEPGSFYTYEEWTSEEKLEKHLAGAKDMVEKARPMLDGEMKLTILEHLL